MDAKVLLNEWGVRRSGSRSVPSRSRRFLRDQVVFDRLLKDRGEGRDHCVHAARRQPAGRDLPAPIFINVLDRDRVERLLGEVRQQVEFEPRAEVVEAGLAQSAARATTLLFAPFDPLRRELAGARLAARQAAALLLPSRRPKGRAARVGSKRSVGAGLEAHAPACSLAPARTPRLSERLLRDAEDEDGEGASRRIFDAPPVRIRRFVCGKRCSGSADGK